MKLKVGAVSPPTVKRGGGLDGGMEGQTPADGPTDDRTPTEHRNAAFTLRWTNTRTGGRPSIRPAVFNDRQMLGEGKSF